MLNEIGRTSRLLWVKFGRTRWWKWAIHHWIQGPNARGCLDCMVQQKF